MCLKKTELCFINYSEEINMHEYQAPLAEATILKVWKQLMNMDGVPTISHLSKVNLTSSSQASDVCAASSSTSFSNPTGSEVEKLIEESMIESERRPSSTP